VHVMDCPRREAPFAVAAAAFERLNVGLADIDRRKLGQWLGAEEWGDILGCDLLIAFVGARRHVGLDVSEPPLHELRERHLGGLNIGTGFHLSDQPRALSLRRALGAFEAVPLAFALAGGRIVLIDNDGETSG
jgi:hypothetical protein